MRILLDPALDLDKFQISTLHLDVDSGPAIDLEINPGQTPGSVT